MSSRTQRHNGSHERKKQKKNKEERRDNEGQKISRRYEKKGNKETHRQGVTRR